jgi:hypothetical protein
MVFTIVTIIFLPLSFIAAFFTINIKEFPHDAEGQNLPLAYVSKYLFGVGFAISIPLIMVALLYDDIGALIRAVKGKIQGERVEMGSVTQGGSSLSLQTIKMEEVFSIARSGRSERRSHEKQWERPASRDTVGTARRIIERAPTGFRMRLSAEDIESGLERTR